MKKSDDFLKTYLFLNYFKKYLEYFKEKNNFKLKIENSLHGKEFLELLNTYDKKDQTKFEHLILIMKTLIGTISNDHSTKVYQYFKVSFIDEFILNEMNFYFSSNINTLLEFEIFNTKKSGVEAFEIMNKMLNNHSYVDLDVYYVVYLMLQFKFYGQYNFEPNKEKIINDIKLKFYKILEVSYFQELGISKNEINKFINDIYSDGDLVSNFSIQNTMKFNDLNQENLNNLGALITAICLIILIIITMYGFIKIRT